MSEGMLVISGHAPDAEGTGPQRRIWSTLAGLARRREIDLLMVGVSSQQTDSGGLASLPLRQIQRVPAPDRHRLARWRAALGRRYPGLFAAMFRRPNDWPHTPWLARHAVVCTQGQRYRSIHTFRLAMAPVALKVAQAAPLLPELHLDLDDLEAHTHQRIADLARRNGDEAVRRRYHAAARALRRLEHKLLPRFSRIYVCSDMDRAAIGLPAARVLPNTCPLPAAHPGRDRQSGFRALFLGSLGYYPNEDALRQIRGHIWPLLRDSGVEIMTAGFGGGARTAALLTPAPGFRHLGVLSRSAGVYAQTDCVIVPLRAGGGTRLKIIESFAHGRPVISTSVGIEGIAAQPEHHFLSAESPEDFARQIRRLQGDPALGDRLAKSALELVTGHHSPAAVEAALTP